MGALLGAFRRVARRVSQVLGRSAVTAAVPAPRLVSGSAPDAKRSRSVSHAAARVGLNVQAAGELVTITLTALVIG